ncbi:MAG: hypothetical protein HYZ57_08550 [Acidobacteria bacterium]|nr:hypothetical protein [Acidobacteriota bacterium]
MRALIFLVAAAASAAMIEQVAGGGAAQTGRATEVKLVEPFAVAFGVNGDWYICEYKGEKITKIDRAGHASTFAGTGSAGYSGDNGPAVKAQLKDPHGIVISNGRYMYVADTLNHVVRRIDMRTATITTVAGTGQPGFSGDGGPAVKAQFNGAFGIDVNRAGDRLYVADLNNKRIREINLRDGTVITVAGNGSSGVPQDGAVAREAPLVDPRAVAVDSKGNIYILERRGNALRVVNRQGRVRTLIAPGQVQPDMKGPKHLCVDRDDSVIIADAENHLVRRYTPGDGKLITIAGTGNRGDKIAAGNPLETELARPHGVAVAPNGDLYISDSYNHRVLRMRR